MAFPLAQLESFAASLLPVTQQAGAVIMDIYQTDFDVMTKDEGSPVTLADQKAEALILPALTALTPSLPIVAEEKAAAGDIPDVGDSAFWLVDPLDGTKEFIKRNGEFTVNIALIDQQQPILGLVYAPALAEMFVGMTDLHTGTMQAYKAHLPFDAPFAPPLSTTSLAVRPWPQNGVTLLGSRSHQSKTHAADFIPYLHGYPIADQIAAGSSLKFCRIAEGMADIYPRFGPTCEWDTAAAHAVLIAAGGHMAQLDGAPFRYGKGGDFLNPHFIARGHIPA
jgi:3'(2'), 5'-bisphosphate nucleotidase